MEVIYEMLDATRDDGTLKRRQYYRLRQQGKKLAETGGLTTESEATKEPQAKIKAAVAEQSKLR